MDALPIGNDTNVISAIKPTWLRLLVDQELYGMKSSRRPVPGIGRPPIRS